MREFRQEGLNRKTLDVNEDCRKHKTSDVKEFCMSTFLVDIYACADCVLKKRIVVSDVVMQRGNSTRICWDIRTAEWSRKLRYRGN